MNLQKSLLFLALLGFVSYVTASNGAAQKPSVPSNVQALKTQFAACQRGAWTVYFKCAGQANADNSSGRLSPQRFQAVLQACSAHRSEAVEGCGAGYRAAESTIAK